MILLQQAFPEEMHLLFEEMCLNSRPQIIALSSFWSKEVMQLKRKVSDSVLLMTCGIEAAISAEVNLVSVVAKNVHGSFVGFCCCVLEYHIFYGIKTWMFSQ